MSKYVKDESLENEAVADELDQFEAELVAEEKEEAVEEPKANGSKFDKDGKKILGKTIS